MNKAPELEQIAQSICKSLGYEYVKFIASGQYKETYCIKIAGIAFALKVLKLKSLDRRTEREIEAMRQLNSPYIAQLVQIGQIVLEDNLYYYLIEQFLDGGSLNDRISSNVLSVDKIRDVGYDISLALAETYRCGLVHRDIKPDNIMFCAANCSAVLVDFGLVRILDEESLTQSFQIMGPGTPVFSSPEQLNNEKALIDWRSDQFSLGVTLYYSRYKKYPFSEGDPIEHVFAVQQRKALPIQSQNRLKEDGLDAIIKMLSRNPIMRFSTPNQLTEAFKR